MPRGLGATGVAVAALFAVPLVYLLGRTAGLGGDAVDVLGSDDAGGPLARTLGLAGSVSAAAAVLGTALAWLVTRTDLPGRRILRVAVALPLVIPSFVGALALLAAFAPGGLVDELFGLGSPVRIEGFWGALVVLTLLTYPYVYLPVAARFAGLPASLEETARTLGRTPFEVMRTVVLPQSTGAIGAGALLVFLYVVSDYGAVSLMRYDTLTRRIDATRLFDPTTATTLSLLLAVVALAVVIGQRSVMRRRAPIEAIGAGRPALRVELGRARVPATCFVLGIVGVALVAPIVVLARWVWLGLDTTQRFGAVDPGSLVSPALNTAAVSVVAALVTTAVVLPVAYLTVRHRTRVVGAVNAVITSGFAIPGLVLALALVTMVIRVPALRGLYQSFPLLVLAYVLHFGAQGLGAAQVAVSGLPRRVDEAARTLGAGRLRRLRTIDLPLLAPGLAAGAGLVLLSTAKELPATLLLAPTGFETLSTRIWGAAEAGFYARAGLASLVLLAVSAALSWLLTFRRLSGG